MKKFNLICALLLSTLSLSACSVGMALSGKKDPNLSVIKKGADRQEIEMQLGTPQQVAIVEDNTVATYEYEIGNEPSAGRAIGHGAMDILTLGLWEIVGTPVEAVQGDKYKITITYDKNDKVISLVKS